MGDPGRFLVDSDPMLARLQTLTEMRMRIMSLLAKRLGLSTEACSMDRVLEAVEDDDRARLEAQAAALKKLLQAVVRHTRRVNVLLRNASETNQALLHALLGEHTPLRPYLPDGQRAPSSGLPHFSRDL